MNKFYFILIFFANSIWYGQAQECDYTLSGLVFDKASQEPLSFVNVFLEETLQGSATDENGRFVIKDICPGEYHLITSHIGCEEERLHIALSRDTSITIYLHHSETSLSEVVVSGHKDEHQYQAKASVNRQVIEDNSSKNLADIVRLKAGVHQLKNGSGIAKPVVHGLYGNRLMILNNGIIQAGQQWGNDHSPEIDPYTADDITVIKGAGAIEYGGGNLGSVVLVTPRRISREPHIHGQVNYSYETNGRGHVLNSRIEKYNTALAWRLNGSLKKYGDRSAPSYYLTNTGVTEANLAMQLEKSWNDRLFVNFYASTFNTTIGVLRGSHIGNITDLKNALQREVPFYTQNRFNYAINAPKQKVSHHLIKTDITYYISDKQSLQLVVAGQLNDRREFDVRRGGRTSRPALSLLQSSFNINSKYHWHLSPIWDLKVGNQSRIIDNTNNPETGILPLIPDYLSFSSGSFATLSGTFASISPNFGIRYDIETQDVASISGTLPRRVIHYNNVFHNLSGLAGIKVELNEHNTIGINTGYAMRNPGINERYSTGLHQGVSGIEEGDPTLKQEHAFKTTLEYEWLASSNFSINTLLYYQQFKNYIFLNPQDKLRLTIRGAFPVFSYEQTDARIFGMDISSQFTISNSLLGKLKYSFIQGDDISNDKPLVALPANSGYISLSYRYNHPIKISSSAQLKDTQIELDSRMVARQNHLLDNQDFTPTPEGYTLFGGKISTNLILGSHKLRCYIKAENILNTKYRDYLNRQRYFADDLGRSIIFGIQYRL